MSEGESGSDAAGVAFIHDLLGRILETTDATGLDADTLCTVFLGLAARMAREAGHTGESFLAHAADAHYNVCGVRGNDDADGG
jgi:hypothetical protein